MRHTQGHAVRRVDDNMIFSGQRLGRVAGRDALTKQRHTNGSLCICEKLGPTVNNLHESLRSHKHPPQVKIYVDSSRLLGTGIVR